MVGHHQQRRVVPQARQELSEDRVRPPVDRFDRTAEDRIAMRLIVKGRSGVVMAPEVVGDRVSFSQDENKTVPGLALVEVEGGLRLSRHRVVEAGQQHPSGESLQVRGNRIFADHLPECGSQAGRVDGRCVGDASDAGSVEAADHHTVDLFGRIGERNREQGHPASRLG